MKSILIAQPPAGPEVARAADAAAVPAAGTLRFPLTRLLRPRHWIKNSFVLAPLVFTGMYLDVAAVTRVLLATALFCIAASAVYIVNDLLDLENDRRHPVKSQTRPLASGAITVRQALVVLGALYAVLLASFAAWPAVITAIGLYLVVNFAYSAKLKHVPVVDLFAIATGFVLRVWAGALAISVPLSSWMLITTLCLALYLAAIKRRQELASNGSKSRNVLGAYSVVLLDRYAEMAAIGAVLFFSLYVVEVRPELTISIPLVLFGLFRYWYIVETLNGGESPTDALVADPPLIGTILLWVALCAYALWPA
jgi:decaprenyl-phosphate phosphoribosyltransferase